MIPSRVSICIAHVQLYRSPECAETFLRKCCFLSSWTVAQLLEGMRDHNEISEPWCLPASYSFLVLTRTSTASYTEEPVLLTVV